MHRRGDTGLVLFLYTLSSLDTILLTLLGAGYYKSSPFSLHSIWLLSLFGLSARPDPTSGQKILTAFLLSPTSRGPRATSLPRTFVCS